MLRVILCAAAIALTGCATSSGVTPLGEDTFSISRNGAGFWSSTAQVKAEALKDAESYCVSKGRKLQVVRTDQHEMSGRPGDFPGAEVQFMCLNSNDPELNRPKLRKEANAVIEIKQDIRTKDSSEKSKDVYSELIKLDDLRKKGILSESEFDTQKKRLLENH